MGIPSDTHRALILGLVSLFALLVSAGTAAAASVTDTAAADFNDGNTGPNTYVSETAGGEVILKPTVGEEFSGGPGLPAGWSPFIWEGGGSATVSGGALHVNGARAGTDATFGPGRSLEYRATYEVAPFQSAGFATDFNNPPWAVFSTKADSQLYARTQDTPANGGEMTETLLPNGLLGSPHRYRIEWAANEVRFFVDGDPVATHAITYGENLRPLTSDFPAAAPELSVDWLRMSPFPPSGNSGNFDSRVLDAGGQASWSALSWTADTPSGTGVALSYRTGNTNVPDGSWSDFTPVPTSGGSIGGSSQFIQYRAQLSSSDPMKTPSLNDVTIEYEPGADATPPTIVGRSPAPGATDVAPDTNVEVQFNEPMDPATINGASFRLRRQGESDDVDASVSYAGAKATLNPDADLLPNTTYVVTVAGAVEDTAGNPLGGGADTWTFTTAADSSTDTTVADFNAGTVDANTYVSESDNGEVILKPTVGEEFAGGPALPAGWSSSEWNPPNGGSTVAGGSLHVDGTRALTDAVFGPGLSLEFSATFGAATFQHVGFFPDANGGTPFAMFSTSNTTNQIHARTNAGAGETTTPIPGVFVGAPHTYRIEWDPGEVRYFIDGNPIVTHPVAIGANLRPLASDFDAGGPDLSLNWLHLSPYPPTGTSGTFLSRVFDGGPEATWDTLSWSADTGVALSVRTGDTSTPDDSWSGFTSVPTSGGAIGDNARYLQYRAELTTSNPGATPALRDVTIKHTPNLPPIAVNDEASVDEDSGANQIDVLGNDNDSDAGPKSVAQVTQPDDGTVAITNSGADLSYEPDPNFCNNPPGTGTDDFTYSLAPGGSTADVAVTVDCVDDNPVAVDDTASVDEDSGANQIDVLVNDTDDDGGPKSVAQVTQPDDGTVAITNSGADLSYEPDPNFCNNPPGTGTDDFTYSLAPGGSTADVAVTVDCVDDNPVAVDDTASVDEDSGANQIDVLGNDTDDDGGPKSVAQVTQPDNGTVVITNSGADLSYEPAPNFCNNPPGTGTDDFTYDLNGGSQADVAVTVDCDDTDPPTAVDDTASVDEDSGANQIDVLGNDTDDDGGPKSVAQVTQPDNGTVQITNSGADLSYEPDPNFCNNPPGTGTDDFTYDLNGGSQADVAVTVDCVDDPEPPGPGPGPDPAGPGTASLSDDSVKVKTTIPLEIACEAGEDCEGTAEVNTAGPVSLAGAVAAKKKKKIVLLGETSFAIRGGQSAMVKAPLTRKGKKLLKRKRKLNAEVTITTEGAGGRVTTEGLKVKKKKRP